MDGGDGVDATYCSGGSRVRLAEVFRDTCSNETPIKILRYYSEASFDENINYHGIPAKWQAGDTNPGPLI